jgi:hypothetical protein
MQYATLLICLNPQSAAMPTNDVRLGIGGLQVLLYPVQPLNFEISHANSSC